MTGVAVVIPVFNEAATIEAIARSAARHAPVLVVDDGSTDGSAAAAARAGAEVLSLPGRRGKGEALRQGFARVFARGATRALTMDGDGQHDPDEIPRLLRASQDEPDALVIGGRLGRPEDGPARPTVIPAGRLEAMQVAGFFIDWLVGLGLRDTQSGFRVYPARLLTAVTPRGNGFVFETEVLVRAAAAGWPIVETPVTARHFPERQSRFRPGRDGMAVGAYLAGRGLARWTRELGVVAGALVRPFTPERMRRRHRELHAFAVPYRHNPGAFMTAVGAFALHRTAETWREWWRDPRARRLRLVASASVLAPGLLALVLARPGLRLAGADPLPFLLRRFYSQERLRETFVRGAGGTGDRAGVAPSDVPPPGRLAGSAAP